MSKSAKTANKRTRWDQALVVGAACEIGVVAVTYVFDPVAYGSVPVKCGDPI